MRFFIGRHGQRLGPFDEQAVRAQLAAGAIAPDDLAWREGLASWQPVRTLFAFANERPSGEPPPLPSPATPPPLPPAPSWPAPPSPTTPDANAHAHAAPAVLNLAGRGARLWATLLDLLVGLVLAGPGLWWLIRSYEIVRPHIDIEAIKAGRASLLQLQLLVSTLSLPLLAVLVPSLVILVVQTWLLTTHGQTLGKRWLRIRIVRTDGRPADFVQVFLLRSMVLQAVALIPVVGPLINIADPLLIFRADRRCLHDLIAGTTVVDA